VAKRKINSFPLPDTPTDVIKLADWIEIYALISADGNSSRGDLERALKRASVFQSAQGDESKDIDECLLQVFLELEERSKSAGDAYPFEISGGTLKLRSHPRNFPAYIFCLALSYFKWKAIKGARVNPWKLFEELSCRAAGHYMQGDVFWFGLRPRISKSKRNGKKKPTLFEHSIKGLCSVLGEGQGFKMQPTLNRQDDKVDLVAWRDFADERPSKLIMFGQCAAGANWSDKITELQPNRFWDQWMQEAKVSELIRSFYMPYRVTLKEWAYCARSAGILFDRCRIAFWTHDATDITRDTRFMKWSGSVMPIRS
jgi:hypothetical protein